VKRLGDEEWEDWEGDLMRRLSFSLPHSHDGQELAIRVALNPRLSEIRFGSGDKAPLVNEAIFDTIVETVLDAIREALSDGRLPVKISILEVAEIYIAKQEPERFGGVSGMERSVPNTFRRMFQNGIFRALKQLPKGSAGAIVIYSKHMPPTEFFRLFYDAATKADPDRFKDLAGVLVCTLNTWFERVPPFYFVNAHGVHTDASKLIGDTFEKTFSAVRA
jgi:hypothetical protein